MTWSYRVVGCGGYFAVHEALYDDDGQVRACTVKPANFIGDTLEDVVGQLNRAVNDAHRFAVLDPATIEPKVDRADECD